MSDNTPFRVGDADGSEQIPVLVGQSSADATKFTRVEVEDTRRALKVYIDGMDATTPLKVDIDKVTIDHVEVDLSGPPDPFEGTATDTAAAVTFTRDTRSVFINNTGDTYKLLVSFNGVGGIYFEFEPESSGTFLVNVAAVHVKCAATETTTYQILGSLEEV